MATVTTRLGPIAGVAAGGIQMFLGIRYGLPPTGELRFLPSVAAPAWSGTFDATRLPNRAMTARTAGTLGQKVQGELSEDCLFLNIYTPAVDNKPRPTMVWIHGGGFAAGSANEYDGRALAKEGDVVVVTINYRLGVFGFLDLSPLGDEFAGSGSNAYRDMMLALKWVQDHIADYGGDPDNVSIFGESAGAAAVLALLGAPAAEGLFHKAIAHSPGGPTLTRTDRTPDMAKKLGVDRSHLVTTLRGMSAAALQSAGLAFGSMVDGVVLTQAPADAIAARGDAGPPLIVGSNRNEGTLFTPADDATGDPTRFDRANVGIATALLGGADPTRYINGLKAAHPEDGPKAIHERVFVDMFRRPSIAAASASTEAGPGGWLYRFDLPTTLPYNGKLTGATHACEMAFTFNAFADPDCGVFAFHDRNDPDVIRLADLWSGTLSRFVWSGDPNGAGLPHWPKYAVPARDCLVLDQTSRVEADPDRIHRQLWEQAVSG